MIFNDEKNLDDILEGMEDTLPQDDPEPEVEEKPEEEVEVDPVKDETPTDNPEQEEDPDKVDKPEEDKVEEEPKPKTNSQFAQQRIKYNKVKRMAKANGFKDVDQYLEHLQDLQDKKEAEDKGIPEDVQKELSQLRARIQAQEEAEAEARRVATEKRLEDGVSNLIETFELDEQGLKDFANQARQRGFDLTNENVSMVDVYRFLNPESEKEREEALRQKILRELEADKKAPSPQTKTNTVSDQPKNMTDLINNAEEYFKKNT